MDGLGNLHIAGVRFGEKHFLGEKRSGDIPGVRFHRDLPGVTVYGDFSNWNRTAVVTLNIGDYDSGAVSDALEEDYGIATRPGAHCAPRMHHALGTAEQGAVRFSFSWFNTVEEVDAAIQAVKELAQ